MDNHVQVKGGRTRGAREDEGVNKQLEDDRLFFQFPVQSIDLGSFSPLKVCSPYDQSNYR
jgi:hypothetical protein